MIQSIFFDLLIVLVLNYSGPSRMENLTDSRTQANCVDCHSDRVEFGNMHYPAEDACDNCHEATGASHPSNDSMGFHLMDDIPALCYYCHEEPTETAHTHQALSSGDCLGCHDAHGSEESSLLRYPDPDLCLSCHMRAYVTDTSETLNIRALVQGNMKAHSAIEMGGCMSCHQAHGSEFRALLVDFYSEADYLPALTENFELCFLCHDTDLMDAAETEWGTGFRDGKKNLHHLHMIGSKGRNCRMCHNLHGSPASFLVEERVGFGSWEMQMNFVPDDQGGSCLPGCHGKLYYKR